jgi:hypothetical protein
MASLKRVLQAASAVLFGCAFPWMASGAETTVNGYADIALPDSEGYEYDATWGQSFATKHKMDCNKTRTDQAELWEMLGTAEEDLTDTGDDVAANVHYDTQEVGAKSTAWSSVLWDAVFTGLEDSSGKCFSNTFTRMYYPTTTAWTHRQGVERGFNVVLFC